jgi:hypothetical protein
MGKGQLMLNHEIILADQAMRSERGGRAVWDVANSAPGPIALGLSLLNEGLIEELIAGTTHNTWRVRIRKAGTPRDVQLQWYGNRRLQLMLGKVELERWLVFFLKYHRDGCAEVDHLDVEGAWDDRRTADFTLKVGSAAASVSDEEARRRLGLKTR